MAQEVSDMCCGPDQLRTHICSLLSCSAFELPLSSLSAAHSLTLADKLLFHVGLPWGIAGVAPIWEQRAHRPFISAVCVL